MKVLGADACPTGWFTTIIDGDDISTATYETFKRLRTDHATADRILIDIPIGLPTDTRRRCDVKARELLGCRGNSVFYSPSENAIKCDNYDEANPTHKNDIGHGLSQQAFHISDKIREVRSVVEDEYDGVVRESHPELCFTALNGQPIAYPKSSPSGRGLRLELLADVIDEAETIYRNVRREYPLSEVRRDDILDSMVLADAAREEEPETVPTNPESKDPRMYYPDFDMPSPLTD